MTLSQLQGTWSASLYGTTAVCGYSGPSAMLVTVQLGANGSSIGRTTIRTHSTACGDSKTIFKKGAQPAFVIQNLYSDGTGTATLKCWTNCSWTFHVQVNPEADAMSLTDLNDANNTPAGLALKKQ